MQFAAASSTETDSLRAAKEACAQILRSMEGKPVDLALLFLSAQHTEKAEAIAEAVRSLLHPKTLLGCTAAGVISGANEIEGESGIALWTAHLPGTRITPMNLRYNREQDSIEGWLDADGLGKSPSFLFFVDPYTIPADRILDKLNLDFKGSPVIGGMASAAMAPGENRLFANGETLREGAVGVAISGPVVVRTVVSQGCRPVGKPFVITGADNNVIHTLGGKPALQQVQDLFTSLPPADQELFRRGIHIGRAVDEMKSAFGRGDFLIRNVVGLDQKTGAIAIGDYVRKGQTVQFHVRDAPSAHEDLRLLLEKEKAAGSAAALLFSCNGRGSHLFGKPHQDAAGLQEKLGELPVAGFFAAGEIGPVGGKNFLHGFTASIALFAPA